MKPSPYLVVAVGVLFASFSAVFIRLSDSPPFIIAAYRMWFTTVVVGGLFLRDRIREAAGGRKPVAAIIRREPPRVILLSIASGIFLSIHFAAWFSSLQYTSIASSTVLVSTHPLIVSAAAFFILHERLSLRAVLLTLAALVGGLVLVVGGLGEGGSAPFGNLLAFVGAVAVSGYMLIGRFVRQRLSANEYTFIVYGVSAVFLTGYAIAAGNPLFGYPGRELLLFLALAVVCTLMGHSLYNWALRFLSPTVISTTVLGEPVIAGLLAILVFGELPTAYTLLGGSVILASIFMFLRESSRSRGST